MVALIWLITFPSVDGFAGSETKTGCTADKMLGSFASTNPGEGKRRTDTAAPQYNGHSIAENEQPRTDEEKRLKRNKFFISGTKGTLVWNRSPVKYIREQGHKPALASINYAYYINLDPTGQGQRKFGSCHDPDQGGIPPTTSKPLLEKQAPLIKYWYHYRYLNHIQHGPHSKSLHVLTRSSLQRMLWDSMRCPSLPKSAQ